MRENATIFFRLPHRPSPLTPALSCIIMKERSGDKVLLSDGTLCEVEGVTLKQLETPETTYNLEVADFHTYYVSDACVLVHNLNCGKSGRGKKLAPDPKAKGPHTTFKRDPSGKVTHYATYQPNSRNPSGFDEILRFDRVGKAHGGVPTPHVHTPQEVRPAFMWEIPL